MSYLARFTGEITITPPLTWAEIRQPGRRPLQDLKIRQHEEARDGEKGRWLEITGVAVTAFTGEPFGGYGMLDELQSLIDAFGASHAFAGYIEALGEEGDQWRLTVRDGRAVQVTPRLVWPDENSEDAQ